MFRFKPFEWQCWWIFGHALSWLIPTWCSWPPRLHLSLIRTPEGVANFEVVSHSAAVLIIVFDLSSFLTLLKALCYHLVFTSSLKLEFGSGKRWKSRTNCDFYVAALLIFWWWRQICGGAAAVSRAQLNFFQCSFFAGFDKRRQKWVKNATFVRIYKDEKRQIGTRWIVRNPWCH